MKDMELLNEKDMEYFRRLAEEGKAVILEIAPETLAALDINQFIKETGEIDQEEVRKWLKENNSWRAEEYAKTERILEENRKIEDWLDTHAESEAEQEPDEQEEAAEMSERANIGSDNVSSFIGKLATIKLNKEQWKVIQEAIDMHLTSEQILLFLKEDMTADEMRQTRDWIRGIVEDND